MYSSWVKAAGPVERVWIGDSVVEPGIGHRSEPVLGADLVFSIVDGDCRVMLQGPVTRRTVYPYRPRAEYIGVRFRPGIGSPVAGLSLADLCDGSAPVARLGSVDLERVADELMRRADLADRGTWLRSTLVDLERECRPPSRLVAAALDDFMDDSSPATVAVVARRLGVSERKLQRSFRSELGIGPKRAARLIRIQRLRTELAARSDPSDLASLAAAVGFFDQSHMGNDVRRVLGTTPGRLLDEFGHR